VKTKEESTNSIKSNELENEFPPAPLLLSRREGGDSGSTKVRPEESRLLVLDDETFNLVNINNVLCEEVPELPI